MRTLSILSLLTCLAMPGIAQEATRPTRELPVRGGSPATSREPWRRHIFNIADIDRLSVDVQTFSARIHALRSAGASETLITRIPGSQRQSVLPSMTIDGVPVKYSLPAEAVTYVLQQPGVVTCEIRPIYDPATGRTSIAVVGLKADGTTAADAADNAIECPPMCGKGDGVEQ